MWAADCVAKAGTNEYQVEQIIVEFSGPQSYRYPGEIPGIGIKLERAQIIRSDGTSIDS